MDSELWWTQFKEKAVFANQVKSTSMNDESQPPAFSERASLSRNVKPDLIGFEDAPDQIEEAN